MQPPRRFNVFSVLASAAVAIAVSGSCEQGSGDCHLSEIQPSTLPDAQVGQTYSVRLSSAVAGPDCDGAPRFRLGEDRPGHETPLPPGLTLSSDGALSGTPMVAGAFLFSVWAEVDCRDGNPYGCSRSAPDGNYTLTIHPQQE